MNGKLAWETTRKLLLLNIPLVLVYLVLQTVTNFVGNGYIKLSVYAESALQLITIVLYALCIASIVVSLYKTFVVDLLSGKSYKYYSLPNKKSEIIFSKTIPAIIIESLIAALLFSVDNLQNLLLFSFDIQNYSGVYRSEILNEMAMHFLFNFVQCLLFAATLGFLILLAIVISRSFDPSKTVRNLLIAIIIEAIANTVLYIVIENISSVYSLKYEEAVQKAVQAAPILTAKELYSAVGMIAYFNEILTVVCILIMFVEIICSIIASKKLADTRFNVI